MTKRFPNLFLAISFHDEDREVRDWFRHLLTALDFNVIEGDFSTPIPPHEKVRAMICNEADCALFVFTRRKKIEGTSEWVGPEWLHQEIGMAFQENKNIGVLIENGIISEGIIPAIVTYERFSREELVKDVPVLLKYLIEFKRIVTGTDTNISEDKIAIVKAVSVELLGHVENIGEDGSIPRIKFNLSYHYVTKTGRIYLLPDTIVERIVYTYARINEFYLWVRSITGGKRTPSFTTTGGKLGFKEHKVNKEIIQQIDEARSPIIIEILKLYVELMGFIEPGFKEELKKLANEPIELSSDTD